MSKPPLISRERRKQALQLYMTNSEPLGPVKQDFVKDDFVAKHILDSNVREIKQLLINPPLILLGRKGSGKSSIIDEIRLRESTPKPGSVDSKGLIEQGSMLILLIDNFRHLTTLLRNVASRSGAYAHVLGHEAISLSFPVEHLQQSWFEILWDDIIKSFYEFLIKSEGHDMLDSITNYIHCDVFYTGSEEAAAEEVFNAARRSVIRWVEDNNYKLYFLFDSLENYPLDTDLMRNCFGGFFRALSQLSHESISMKVSFCLPLELRSELSKLSSANIEKDFSASHAIEWRPMSLLQIVAHRYRLYLELKEDSFYEEISGYEFSDPQGRPNRDDIRSLFRTILPDRIVNSYDIEEDCLAVHYKAYTTAAKTHHPYL